jgi:hypothetical protein
MNTLDRHRTGAKTLTIVGLIVGAAGILTQYFSGVEGFPTIPPGSIILLAAAAVLALGSRRWTIALGVFAALFVLVGGTIATALNWGGRAPLSNPAEPGGFIGAIIQFVGVVTALVAGIVTLRDRNHRRRVYSY